MVTKFGQFDHGIRAKQVRLLHISKIFNESNNISKVIKTTIEVLGSSVDNEHAAFVGILWALIQIPEQSQFTMYSLKGYSDRYIVDILQSPRYDSNGKIRHKMTRYII